MKNILSVLFLLSLLIQSCGNNKSDDNTDVVIPNEHEKVAKLEENLTMVGEILSVDFVNEEDFIISTRKPASVILYGPSGQQKTVISKVGQGPYEFLEPDIVKVFNEHIYVWCPSQLKLIKYSLDGTPHDEYSGFSKAIKDFVPFGDRIVFYHSGGNYDEGFVEIYDLDNNKSIYKGGEASNEHAVLSLLSCSGAMVGLQHSVLFMSPDQLKIDELDLNDRTQKTLAQLDDDEFKVEKVGGDATSFINNEREKVVNYIFANSVVNGIFALDGAVIVKSEIGEVEADFENSKFDDSNRFNLFHIFSHDMELKKRVVMEKNSLENPCLFASNGKSIHSLITVEEGDDYYYELIRYSFDK